MHEAMHDEEYGPAGLPSHAIDDLYRHEAGRLTRFFARRVRREAEAQDLMQDAFLRLSRAKIEGDPLPYLLRIARNLLISSARRDARWRRLITEAPLDEEIDFASPPEQSFNLEAEDVKRQFQKVIDQLPEKTRRVYLMHRLEGHSYLEIADKLEINVKTVEYHIASALKSLVRGVDQK